MKLLKKMLAGVLAAAITAFSCVPAVYATDDGTTEEASAVPIFYISNGTDYTISAGVSTMIPIQLAPRTTGDYSKIIGTLTSGTSEITVRTKDQSIATTGKTLDFSIYAPKTALPGTYDLSLSIIVCDITGAAASTQTLELKVTVKSDLKVNGLNIESYSTSINPVRPGDHFDLTFILNNETNMDITDAELSLEGLDASKFLLDKGFPKKYVSIGKGRREKVTFPLIAQNGISLERENLTLQLSYNLDKDRGDVSRQTSTYVIINCIPNSGAKEQNYGAHDLSMTGYRSSVPTIKNGTKFTLTVDIKNSSAQDIKGARVSVGADGAKFSLDSGLGYSDIDVKAGETKQVVFKLMGCAGIASVREAIPITIEFGSQSSNVFATVACESEKADSANAGKYDLTLTNYTTDVKAIAENTMFTLSLEVTNGSARKIEKARVSVLNLDGMKFAVDSGLTYSDFDIAAGETKQLSFRLIGCSGISSVREVIPIQIDYGDISSQAYVTVTCLPKDGGKDDSGKQVFAPNIIIENYEFGGDFVTAGQQFPLTISIKNMSSSATVENLKVTITGGTSSIDGSMAYSPANSSNSFFFEKLGTYATETINMDLLAKADAAPNSYPVLVSFAYEYSVNDQRYQATGVTENITIPLRQEDRLTINEPELPGWGVSVGEMCSLSTSLVNKGKSAVYNVTATVEGDGFSVETPSYYIGNINSGAEEYYDAKLTPYMEGEISGNIVFTYEDANGTAKETRIPFTFTAITMNYGGDFGFDDGMYDGGMYDDGMMPDGTAEEGIPFWVWLAGSGVVCAAVIVIIVIVVKKKKKKAELVDDDEDL